MALTANRNVDHYVDQELRSFAVAASAHIYKGALVGLTTGGYARALSAGDPFVGVAYEEADNNEGTDGAIRVRVYTTGDFAHALSGATVAHIGRPVFASADDTLTFTADGNSYVGQVENVPASNEIILRIDPGRRAVKTITHAVEDLAAGADIAARAIHAFGKAAWIVAARVVNQATAAVGIDNSNTCVVALDKGGQSVASRTFNSATPFPAVNTATSMGTILNARADSGDVLTLSVTNGVTANPGPFLIEVDYV